MRFVRFLICSQSMAESRRKQSDVIDLLFFNRKIDELNDYLSQNPNLDLKDLLDSQGNTVLHQLAYEGHLDIIKLFIRYARKFLQRIANQKKQLYQKEESSAITTWMNHRNNQGFTPLLYASYSGHIDIIRYFVEELHINQRLTTNSGVNPLHLAAQKNVLLPFLYFRSRIDINQEDKHGGTALHWAAYMNSEQVVAYLLAEPSLSCLDKKDNDGNTALMNAVAYGNTRIVRRLLIRGANRYLRNSAGKTPLDVARENEFHTISKMLNEEYSCADLLRFYCNVKIEYRPKQRKMTLPVVFLTVFALSLTILNTLLKFQQQYGLLVQSVGMGLLFLLYLTLLFGPSKPSSKTYEQFLSGSQKSLKKVCFECKNIVPKRGYHCDTCGVCIRQYDHHCTWINNCVGKRNIARFILFLFFLVIALGFVGLVSFLGGLSVALEDFQLYSEWLILRNPYETELERYLVMGMLGFNCLVSLFVLPVLMLFLGQIKNLLKNKTTYEVIRGPPEEENPIKDKIRRYNSRVSLRNCKHMCKDNSSTSSRSSFKSEEQITDKFLSEKNHT